MHRWLLAVTALVLGIGFMFFRAYDSAALQQKMETPPSALAVEPHGLPFEGLSPEPVTIDSNDAASLDAQIETWIRSLSAEEAFRHWQGARWSRYPLGPGMHGWLVLLHKDGKEIGYLVVGATEDGKLRLTEYGAGDNPLFSMNTLYRSLIQHELIRPDTDLALYLKSSPPPPERLYFGPLHAVWKLQHEREWIYLDAKTGERLPLSAQSFLPLQPFNPSAALPEAIPQLTRSIAISPFDPFDNTYWISDTPLPVASARDLLATIGAESPPVTFTANLYGKTVLVPLAVTGYHDWSGSTPYIRLEQEGERYVPFDVLLQYGSFHRQRISSFS